MNPDRFGILAEALTSRTEDAVGDVIGAIDEMVDRMNLPRRLRDAGIAREDLRPAAEATLADPAIRTNPRQPRNVEELVAFLEAIF